MGTSLNGLTPADTYSGLLKFGDNNEVTSVIRSISDGDGNDLPFRISTSSINNTGNNITDQNSAFGQEALQSATSATRSSAFGYRALQLTTTGVNNSAVGNQALRENLTGSNNTAVGYYSLRNGNSHINNSALGANTQSGNFSGSVILGKDATATANNQFVVGSTGTNAGAVTTETITPDTTWTVRINGANYKIPMLAI